MRALITGIAGFAGGHLANWLLSYTDYDIWGCDRRDHKNSGGSRVHLITCDLTDADAVRRLIDLAQPDLIFHLAAQAHVATSWQDPWNTFEQNVHSQFNLLEAVVISGKYPRMLVIGSNEEYGAVPAEDLPIDEETPLQPDSPYGVSKVAQDLMGRVYAHSHNLPIVRVRPFNHIGPGQAPIFAAPAFARQLARIEAGLQSPVIRVGNLAVERDFTDVRDVVRAYYLVLTQGLAGEVYNVGSGESHSAQEILDILLSFSDQQVRVEVDPSLLRPVDMPRAVCDATRLYRSCGWRPTIPLRQTLADLLAEWREKVKDDRR